MILLALINKKETGVYVFGRECQTKINIYDSALQLLRYFGS